MPTRRQFLIGAVPVAALLAAPLAIPLAAAAADATPQAGSSLVKKKKKLQCCGYSGTHTVVTGYDPETASLITQELRLENGLIVSIS